MSKKHNKLAKMQAKKKGDHTGPSQKVINMATKVRKICSGYSPEKKRQLLNSATKRMGKR